MSTCLLPSPRDADAAATPTVRSTTPGSSPQLADLPVRVLLHEIRSPLNAMVATLELLRRRHPADSSVAEAVARVRRQIALVQAIMEDADAAESRRTLGGAPDVVEVGVCIRDAVDLCAPTIELRRHRLDVRAPTPAIWWHGRASRLVQALANLVDNAAKYTREQGSIRVTLGTDGREIAIVVEDDGIGLSSDGLRSVMAPFVRGAAGGAINPGGNGIGLALADEFARRSGGRLLAASLGEGHGCSFTLCLPAAASLHARDVPHGRR
jgi:signal transduction histidine kinase